MIPSPYAPGSLPGYLAGRGRELGTIRDRAARSVQLGRSGGPLLVFHGPRGLGKTSLLRTAQRQVEASGLLTAWLTGRDDVALAPVLAAAVADEVRRRSWGERARGLLDGLEKVQVEVGAPGAKVGVELDAARDADPDSPAGGVERTLQDAGRFAREHGSHGLVLFVDEVQDVRVGDLRSLLIALQHFDGAPRGCPVTVVGAGLPSALGAVPAAATFGERSDFEEVGLLSDVAVAEALRVPAEELGVRWSDAAVEAGIDVAGGYPHQVQLIGDGAWTSGRPERGDELTAGHVRQGAELASRRMANLFRSRLAKLTSEQRRLVDAMAAEGDGAVRRSALARRLATTSEALSRPRQELVDRGLLEVAGRGMLRFTIPGFAAFLRAQDHLERDR